MHTARSQTIWMDRLTCLFASCVTLGKCFNVSVSEFLYHRVAKSSLLLGLTHRVSMMPCAWHMTSAQGCLTGNKHTETWPQDTVRAGALRGLGSWQLGFDCLERVTQLLWVRAYSWGRRPLTQLEAQLVAVCFYTWNNTFPLPVRLPAPREGWRWFLPVSLLFLGSACGDRGGLSRPLDDLEK